MIWDTKTQVHQKESHLSGPRKMYKYLINLRFLVIFLAYKITIYCIGFHNAAQTLLKLKIYRWFQKIFIRSMHSSKMNDSKVNLEGG